MVDYETYCRIRDHLQRQALSVAQTARALGLDVRTVAKWAHAEQFRPRKGRSRPSKLDPYKGQIVRWLDENRQQAFRQLLPAQKEGRHRLAEARRLLRL